jgi:probable phosphoglycerate mutase
VLQGLTYPELESRHPAVLAGMQSRDHDYRIPEGESANDRFTRNVACLEDLAARHPGATILVVCHGGVLTSFLDRCLDLPPSGKRHYSLLNAAINVVSISSAGDWRLETWGEIAHLRQAGIEARDDT